MRVVSCSRINSIWSSASSTVRYESAAAIFLTKRPMSLIHSAQIAVVWHCGVLGSALLTASLVMRCMAAKWSTSPSPVSLVLWAPFASDTEGVGPKDAACLQEFEAAGADDEGVSSVSYNNPIGSNNAYHWIRTYRGWPFICLLRLKLLCLNPSMSSPSPSSAPSAPLPPSTSHAIDKSHLGMWGASSPIACQPLTKGKISS